MPAVSRRQREAIAIAEHHPSKLYARNRGLLKMKRKDMHDFASTPEKGLPEHAGGKKMKVRNKGIRKHKKTTNGPTGS